MLTLSEVKTHLKIDHSTEDSYLNTLIFAAYSFAESYTGRVIVSAEKVDHLDDFETEITLKHTPVQSITSITYYDSDDVQQSQTDFYLNIRNLRATLSPLLNDSWPGTNGNYENVAITYQCGYVSIPEQINQAVLLIIGDLYENRTDTITGVSLQNTGAIGNLLSAYRIVSV